MVLVQMTIANTHNVFFRGQLALKLFGWGGVISCPQVYCLYL